MGAVHPQFDTTSLMIASWVLHTHTKKRDLYFWTLMMEPLTVGGWAGQASQRFISILGAKRRNFSVPQTPALVVRALKKKWPQGDLCEELETEQLGMRVKFSTGRQSPGPPLRNGRGCGHNGGLWLKCCWTMPRSPRSGVRAPPGAWSGLRSTTIWSRSPPLPSRALNNTPRGDPALPKSKFYFKSGQKSKE